MRDPLDTRGQEREQEAQAAKQRERQRIEVEDFKWLMAHKQGRRFVWRLLERTHLFKTSFTGSSETFFKEGERNVGLRVMDLINDHAVEQYLTMVKEHKANDT